MKVVELKPIKEDPQDYEALEQVLIELFKSEIYLPLLKSIRAKPAILKNSADDLISAINSGRVTFNRGYFSGKFNSRVTQELKKLGAKWDRRQGMFKIPLISLPQNIRSTIEASAVKSQKTMAKIMDRLSQMLPDKIADKIKIEKLFDQTIYKTEKKFQDSVKNITVPPTLPAERKKKLAEEYTNNMKLYIKDWAEKEIKSLRKEMEEHSFKGIRYEAMVKTIQKSYGVSQNKAKFLARQETSLLMTKYKQDRYQSAGVNKYIWRTVAGSPNHPVRPMHKALDGKVFSWNNPPITDENGSRNHPGQDFNCRCYAKPIVEF